MTFTIEIVVTRDQARACLEDVDTVLEKEVCSDQQAFWSRGFVERWIQSKDESPFSTLTIKADYHVDPTDDAQANRHDAMMRLLASSARSTITVRP